MSDLFKDHKPELTEDEDRLLWQRVRAIPALETAPALRPVPWWQRLWAMPGVRYGAPAFAVLVAAVVWVTQREPEFQPRSVGKEAPSALQTAPPATDAQPVPTRNSARVTAVDEPKPDAGVAAGIPTKDKAEGAEWRADEVAPSETQQGEEVAAQSAPKVTVLRKEAAPPSAPSATFAEPPPETVTGARRMAAGTAPPAPESKASAPQWGGVKDGYRDSGNAARLSGLSVPDQLAQGTLPDPSTLADHPVVQAASPTAHARAANVPLPIDIATHADLKLYQAHSPAYRDLEPGEQAAAIAYAFERALGNPQATPRARVERMLVYAKAIEDRAGKAEKAGATKLVAMIEGALRAWP